MDTQHLVEQIKAESNQTIRRKEKCLEIYGDNPFDEVVRRTIAYCNGKLEGLYFAHQLLKPARLRHKSTTHILTP